jgi:hypothetical protein
MNIKQKKELLQENKTWQKGKNDVCQHKNTISGKKEKTPICQLAEKLAERAYI